MAVAPQLVGTAYLRTIFRRRFVAEARRYHLQNPEQLWATVYRLVDGAGVVRFIGNRIVETADRQLPADVGPHPRSPNARAARRSNLVSREVREATIVIHHFVELLAEQSIQGRWSPQNIRSVQLQLKESACTVYPCKAVDDD